MYNTSLWHVHLMFTPHWLS